LHLRKVVRKRLAEAETLNMIDSKQNHKYMDFIQGSFVQEGARVDPADPEYKFHAKPLIDLLKKLKTDYDDQKTAQEKIWTEREEKCNKQKQALADALDENSRNMDGIKVKIETLATELAEHKEDLVEEETSLKEDEAYLTELTKKCHDSAVDFDQQATMRAEEIKALKMALGIMKDTVKEWETADVSGGFLQVPTAHADSFLQVPSVSTPGAKLKAFLARGAEAASPARRQRALEMLSSEGRRLKSVELMSLIMKLGRPDPFVKVKSLITALIVRLLDEEKMDSAHKGFCDENVKSLLQDRDYRYTEVTGLHAQLSELGEKTEDLKRSIKDLKEEIQELEEDLAEANQERDEEKAENVETLLQGKKALNAVQEALQILKVFYAMAARGKVLLIQGVDDDTTFKSSGANKGNQDKGNKIIDAIEKVEDNFKKKIAQVETEEKEAAFDHLVYQITTEKSIGGKTTKRELNKSDLEATKEKIKRTVESIESTQKLLDQALKELNDIKPTCYDNGMSHKERKKQREETIAALKYAQCILDPNGKEEDCKQP